MLLRYTQESAQPFIYKGYALFVSKLEIRKVLMSVETRQNESKRDNVGRELNSCQKIL